MINHQTKNGIDAVEEPEAFLLRRGIAPENGSYLVEQLNRELTRRGWRSEVGPEGVSVRKAFSQAGTNTGMIYTPRHDLPGALVWVLAQAIQFDEERGLSLSQAIRADIIVRAPDGRTIAIGEVKGGEPLSDELAASIRRNLVSNSSNYALVPFFLLVTRENGYLWDQRAGVLPFSQATRKFPMDPVIKNYFPWLEPDERPGRSEVKLASAAWLQDLADQIAREDIPARNAFEGTDFGQVIKGASVETDARA